jgi:hypothetical protein
VGEVHVPEGAEVLILRTRKADGTSREAEEIAGKSTISAPELGVGDFVESETLEVKEPSLAFAPGFVASASSSSPSRRRSIAASTCWWHPRPCRSMWIAAPMRRSRPPRCLATAPAC